MAMLLGRLASRLQRYGVAGRSSSSQIPIQSRLQQFFRRGISEIHFNYDDPVWFRLWQSVAKIPYTQGVLPIVHEYMKHYPVQKNHLLNIIYKLRIVAKYAQGVEICEWMIRERPFPVDASDYILRIQMVGRLSKFRATQLFWEMPAEMRSEQAYTEILRVFARWHAVPAAEDTMSEMNNLNLITSPDPYNIIMDMYKRLNSDDKISAAFTELKARGITPDIQTYLIALRSKTKIENLEQEAREFVAAELRRDHRHPLFILEYMVKIYAMLGDSSSVENLLGILRRRSGKKLSSSTYSCMLDAYKLLGEVGNAEKMFNDIGNNTVPLSRQYRDMISVYCEHEKMDKAEELYKELFRSGLQCHPMIYHSMVAGYIKIREYEKAYMAYGKARDRSVLGHPKPLRATLLLIMRVVAEQGDIKRGEKILEEISGEPRAICDVQVWNLLLKAYIKAEAPAIGFDGRMLQNNAIVNGETRELLKQANLPAHSKKKKKKKIVESEGVEAAPEDVSGSGRTIGRRKGGGRRRSEAKEAEEYPLPNYLRGPGLATR